MMFLIFFKILPERGHQEDLKTGVKLLFHFSNFCLKIVRVTVTLSKCQCHKNKAVSNNQILASFLKLGQNPRMTSEKNVFFRRSCVDFVLASKMKPKFDCLTSQVMPELSIFSKCNMLQGCDMSHVRNNLYFFA